MNQPQISHFTKALVQVFLLVIFCTTSVFCYAEEFVDKNNQTAISLLSYEQGLIDAKINKIALGTVFHELALKTNIQINLYSFRVSKQLISVNIAETPLAEAIGIMLQGFSYVLYPVDRGLVVSVLSPSEVSLASTILPESSARTGITYISVVQENEELSSMVTVHVRPDIDADIEMNSDPNSPSDQEQDYIETLLEYAGNASTEQIDEEMLDELVNIDDPRATEILIDATTSNMDKVSSTAAINIIWRHTKNLENFDAVALGALQQLAQDHDDNVRTIARQALHDIQQENVDEF